MRPSMISSLLPLLFLAEAYAAEVFAPDFVGLRAQVHQLVDNDRLAGAVLVASQQGQIVFRDAYGRRDLDPAVPATPDTIFLLASMTKPITGAAMMILYQEGKWRLDDPVAMHIPAFADLLVEGQDGPVPQTRPMTMADLMSHSAGFDVNQAPAYEAVNLRDRTHPMQLMIDKLASLPLAFQPGTAWRYGPGADVQAYLIEKWSNQRFEAFLQDRIFTPLGMEDTGFWPVGGAAPGRVSPEKVNRLSTMFSGDADGRVLALPDLTDPSARPPFPSGSGGLMSTASDYERFARMLLNGGELDGVRILDEASVSLMRQNMLSSGLTVTNSPGVGFGLNLAVVEDADADPSALPAGAYYWAGGSGTFFWIDPAHELVFVGMVHAVGRTVPDVRTLAIESVYSGAQQ